MKVIQNTNKISGVAVCKEQDGYMYLKYISPDAVKGEMAKVQKSNCPENLVPGTHFVTMAGSKDKVYQFRPVEGKYKVKFSHFVHAENQPPVPKEQVGQFGNYKTFYSLFQVLEGPYAGCEVPVMLHYKFERYLGDDGEIITAIKGDQSRSIHVARLVDFMMCAGVMDVKIPYTENILPHLEQVIQNKGASFFITMLNGYVDGFSQVESIGADSDFDPSEFDKNPF